MSKLRLGVEKDRRHYMSIGNVLTILGLLGVMATSYGLLAADYATMKQKLVEVDRRNDETRREIKDVATEIKSDVKEVKGEVKELKSDTQLILRKLDSIEAVRQADRAKDRR